MMERKQSAARAAALALAERAARMAERERRIATELAGFLGARERYDAIVEHAQQRCEVIMARARRRATASQAQAEAHVVELVALIGDRQEVAEHTGLSLREIRRALREAQEDTDTEDAEACAPDAEGSGAAADDLQDSGDEEIGREEDGVDEPDSEGTSAMESAPRPAAREDDTGRDDTGEERDLGQEYGARQEESDADRDEISPAPQGSPTQGWSTTAPNPGPEMVHACDIAADGDTEPDTSQLAAASAGEVPLDGPGTPMSANDVLAPDASLDLYTNLSAGLDPQLFPDVAASGSGGTDVSSVAGWQASADESWWSSSPDSAA